MLPARPRCLYMSGNVDFYIEVVFWRAGLSVLGHMLFYPLGSEWMRPHVRHSVISVAVDRPRSTRIGKFSQIDFTA